MKPTIYIDLDGVLANFTKTVSELLNGISNLYTPQGSINWETLAPYPHLYSILHPMADSQELFDGCVEVAGLKQVCILTAIPLRESHRFPNIVQNKIDWVHQYIHPDIKVMFGPFSQYKHHHVRHSQDVLIDDNPLNVHQWESSGGIGILHKNAKTSLDFLYNSLYDSSFR